ncbi:MAG: hypothetical protein JWQ00_2923, partial [Noviherbaspirillum sp.]|nr:hypothetical protein [Noviherbaspirillum sp.]
MFDEPNAAAFGHCLKSNCHLT